MQHLAAGLSILLTTTMTFFSMSSALRSTKRVCGIGPSTESTRSSTPAHSTPCLIPGIYAPLPMTYLGTRAQALPSVRYRGLKSWCSMKEL